MATMHRCRPREESCVHAATVCESADLSQILMSYMPGRFRMKIINEQTGSELSTTLFSPAHSNLTFRVPSHYTPLVTCRPIHGLILAFIPVGRLFGTNRLNTLISMRARVAGRVVPNMESLPWLQIINREARYWESVSLVHTHICPASLPGMWERTITIGSAGKTFSATGWKVLFTKFAGVLRVCHTPNLNVKQWDCWNAMSRFTEVNSKRWSNSPVKWGLM